MSEYFRLDPRSSQTRGVIWFHLDNFDIDSPILKAQHRDDLHRIFRHNMANGEAGLQIPVDRLWVYLRGYASRAWQHGPNRNYSLSQARVNAVREFLSAYVSTDHITGTVPVGQIYSDGPLEEDPEFRSVEVIITVVGQHPPPQRPTDPWILDLFAMRAKIGRPDWTGFSSGMIQSFTNIPGLDALGESYLNIEIKRMSDHVTQEFIYKSIQISANVSALSLLGSVGSGMENVSENVGKIIGAAIGATENIVGNRTGASHFGEWSYFVAKSHRHVQFWQFEGDASYGNLHYWPGENSYEEDDFFRFESSHLNTVNRRGGDYIHIYPIYNVHNRPARVTERSLNHSTRNVIVLDVPSVNLNQTLISMSAFGRLIMKH